MLSRALIIPTERPMAFDELKRALISYDTVYVPSPDDREIIPPNAYNTVLTADLGLPIMPGMGMYNGPIRPLGKLDGYDDAFEKIIDQSTAGLSEGKIRIIPRTIYNTALLTFGSVPLPPGIADPLFTYHHYRRLAESQKFVDLIGQGLKTIDLRSVQDLSRLCPGGNEDLGWSINGRSQPPVAKIVAPDWRDDETAKVSTLAHAKLGTLVRYLGLCSVQNINPFTTDSTLANVLFELEKNFSSAINTYASEVELIRRHRRISVIQNLVFKEHIRDNALSDMSVKDIIKLRTKAWGKNQEEKQKFIALINQFALICESDKEFEKECQRVIDEYIKATQEYYNELDNLKLKFTWSAVGAFVAGNAFEMIEKFTSAPSLGALVILGATTVIPTIGDVVSVFDKNTANKESTGYTIYKHFSYIK